MYKQAKGVAKCIPTTDMQNTSYCFTKSANLKDENKISGRVITSNCELIPISMGVIYQCY